MSNLFKKILALALASVLWVFVNSSLSVIAFQDTVPIQYKSLNSHLILLQGPKQMSYHLQANPDYSKNIKTNITISVNLENITAGWHTLPILYSVDTSLPAYARIKLASKTVRVFIDERYFKNVDIVPFFDFANKKSDYVLSKISVEPSSILISGPKSIINNIKEVKTNPILISQRGDYKKNQLISLESPNISTETENVLVQYSVQLNVKPKKIVIPVTVEEDSLPSSLKVSNLSISSVEFHLQGLSSQLDAIESDSTILTLNLKGITKPGIYRRIPLKVSIPKNVTIIVPKQPLFVDVLIEGTTSDLEPNNIEPEEETTTIKEPPPIVQIEKPALAPPIAPMVTPQGESNSGSTEPENNEQAKNILD